MEGPVSEYERVKDGGGAMVWDHRMHRSHAESKGCARTPWVSAPEGAEITPAKD
jgi:hypothetical protein